MGSPVAWVPRIVHSETPAITGRPVALVAIVDVRDPVEAHLKPLGVSVKVRLLAMSTRFGGSL
jgi:hypothetical protein